MNDLDVTSSQYSARPRISIQGQNRQDLSDSVTSLSVHESDDGIYRCEVSFVNWGENHQRVDFLYFDRESLDFGHELTIEMGEGDTEAEVFSGRITGIEGLFLQQRSPEILILAEDRLQDLRMVRRTRTFEDVSVDDVIQQIAGEYGLQADIDLDSPTYRVLAQMNQSDLAFIRERVREVDADIWIEGDTLRAQSKARRNNGDFSLRYQQRLKEFSVLADLSHQRTHLAIGGWDIEAKETLEVEVETAAIQPELNGGRSGGEILAASFGRRRETVVHLAPASTDEARTMADAYYRKMARKFVSGRGIAEGDGRLRAGAHVTLEGIGSLFNGAYYINAVHHLFTLQQGYQTFFWVERAGLGAN
ncbi:contractile injection system protein, VgrG/Pvc8 family [uncultured Desulfobacter sp.]|uniref:phage late control D family protein n=1 Tax=uncultured Desulfobacter sp. TaxID=240139 RepID=UPI002AA8C454|nr:contractile injection system protein, VgrG/Pvc8 family [uncultured Desulfobacter sp.]